MEKTILSHPSYSIQEMNECGHSSDLISYRYHNI